MDTEKKEIKQLSQKYSLPEIDLIEKEAKKQRLKVATLIRKLTLDSVERSNK